ncbi:MAG: putative integrity scanning protein DisA, partial [Actinomycetota bacterium]
MSNLGPAADALHAALAAVAPGTPLRDGLDRVVRAKMGALVVIGDGPDVLAICSGGFLLDSPFSPQRMSELAKMDGAIILSDDCTRIARANVHLVPDPTVPTSETGTRHRTSERVARSLNVPVASVSEEMGVINVYAGGVKHQVQDIGRLLDRANQALQTLERYTARLNDGLSALTSNELEDVVTVRDVAAVVQRGEMVHHIARELETMVVELGVDARLLRLQLDEVYAEVDDEIDLVAADYPSITAQYAVTGRDGDAPAMPRGLRLLTRVPRMTPILAVLLVDTFGELSR